MAATAQVRVGIGGWTFEPWRDNFYPAGLPHARELAWASRQVTAIEVNGTFYSTFGPSTFAKWRDETPEGFRFSLKAHRSATHRRELAGAGEAIGRFVRSGIAELGDKLGPIVWPFMPAKAFDAADLDRFLALLPRELDGRPLQHALDVRHPSFACDEYLDIARRHGCVTVHTDSPQYPGLVDAEGPFAYLRLMRNQAALPTGYPPDELDAWASGARRWSSGPAARDAWIFFINGEKERAPAAAQALLQRLGSAPMAGQVGVG